MSYPMVYYDSEVRNQVINIIKSHFKDVKIIDPANLTEFPHGKMDLYYSLVDDCDILVYIPFIQNIITAGVFGEVKYALKHGKRVYRYTEGRLERVRSLNDIKEKVLDVDETRRLYRVLEVVDEMF